MVTLDYKVICTLLGRRSRAHGDGRPARHHPRGGDHLGLWIGRPRSRMEHSCPGRCLDADIN